MVVRSMEFTTGENIGDREAKDGRYSANSQRGCQGVAVVMHEWPGIHPGVVRLHCLV